ncbi:MAG: hypothetical protein U0736_19090 [Gemmataceae bacterium]
MLALGEGRRLENGSRAKFAIKVDDRVLFSSYSGTEVNIDGEDLLLMSEEDILAIVS